MNTTEFVFVDLSSIAYPIWHMSQGEPDINAVSRKIVDRVRTLANGHTHVAVCCDSGKSFRHDVSPAYKANRPEKEAPLLHQIDLAKEALAHEGFVVWSARGFEADDVIATAVQRTLALPDATALIISSDKDLLQLVSPRVRAMSARDGSIFDEQAVATKFGCLPSQMRDYLTLVGDASDNIKGAKGIGEKGAAKLLTQFVSLDNIYADMAEVGAGGIGLSPSIANSLKELKDRLEEVRRLVTLRTDVDLPFEELTAERVSKATDEAVSNFVASIERPTAAARELNDFANRMRENVAHEEPSAPQPPAAPSIPATPIHEAGFTAPVAPEQQLMRVPDAVLPAPAEWERGLDPRSMPEARTLALDMYESRMFNAYGTPQAVLSTMMVGRELGLPAMASLRCIHIIEGKHSLSASLMAALVLKSGMAEFFEPIEISDTSVTFETKRMGARNALKLTHTIQMARQAFPKKANDADTERAWANSGWGKNPTDMLVARCQARLARLVYPDLLAGLYTPEELDEIRLGKAA